MSAENLAKLCTAARTLMIYFGYLLMGYGVTSDLLTNIMHNISTNGSRLIGLGAERSQFKSCCLIFSVFLEFLIMKGEESRAALTARLSSSQFTPHAS